MRKNLFAAGLLLALTTLTTAQVTSVPGLVINEVNSANGGNGWIELANFSGSAIDISGFGLLLNYDNLPGSTVGLFTFPGAPGSGTTVIQPENTAIAGQGFLVVAESLAAPVLPAGAIRVTGISIPAQFFNGIPFSCALYDASGNGVDYVAGSNTNAFSAPLFQAAGAPTEWAGHPAALNPVGGGAPIMGTVLGSAGAEDTFRHSRVDTDAAADWTNNTVAGTPGTYNSGQFPLAFAVGTLPVASFTTTSICGPAPLTVGFQNVSTAETEIDTLQGGTCLWDFDATANPLTSTSTSYHTSNVFSLTQDVTLTVIDQLGGSSTTPVTTITAIGGLAPTPITNCAVIDFENGVFATVPNPCGGIAIPDPLTGTEFRGSGAQARFRVVDSNSLGLAFNLDPAITAGGNAAWGKNVLLLDVSGATSFTSQFIVHIDTTSFAGGEFIVSYSLLENNDESDPQDYVAVSDGVTAGNQAHATAGNAIGVPGLDGKHEELINPWNIGSVTLGTPIVGNRSWVTYTHTFDNAWFAAHPNVIQGATDFRLIISQRDNVSFEGNDGLAVDEIVIRPLVPVATPMQASDTTKSAMDINFARNDNCELVASNLGGPYRSTANFGGQMNLSFMGEPNQPIFFMADATGTATDNVFNYVNSELNVGAPSAIPPFFLTNISVLANGTQTDFLNALFRTGASGTVNFNLPVTLPVGTYAFQALLFISGPDVIKFSNPIVLTVQ